MSWKWKLFEEVKTENYLNFMKNINKKIQEAQQTSNANNTKKTTPRSIIIKFLKPMSKREIQ